MSSREGRRRPAEGGRVFLLHQHGLLCPSGWMVCHHVLWRGLDGCCSSGAHVPGKAGKTTGVPQARGSQRLLVLGYLCDLLVGHLSLSCRRWHRSDLERGTGGWVGFPSMQGGLCCSRSAGVFFVCWLCFIILCF